MTIGDRLFAPSKPKLVEEKGDKQAAPPGTEDGFVRWVQVISSNEVRIFAYSPKSKDLFVTIKITGENILVKPAQVKERPVSTNDKDPIVVVRKLDEKKPFKFSSIVQSFFGKPIEKPSNNYIYALPFQPSKSYLVSQGCRGHTHKISTDYEYAVDFAMPKDSLVYSAREGEVVAAQDEYDNNGGGDEFLKLSNGLIIRHPDGTYGTYGHLKHRGIYVRVGDFVRKGQLIASSGNTGQSSGPHLHFDLIYVDKARKSIGLPITFETASGLVTNLKSGQIVTSKSN